MLNVKQKFLKLIISFICLISVRACNQSDFKHTRVRDLVNVAILLPLSGPKAKFGTEYVKMIKIGLSDSAKTKIKVTTYDSEQQKLTKDPTV